MWQHLPASSSTATTTQSAALLPGAYSFEHCADIKNRWDDWVPQERLRKFTEENRELAAQIRREMTAQMWAKGNPTSKTGKKRAGSDSGRGSEERQSSVPAKGTKRGRDNEIERVSIKSCTKDLKCMY